MLVSDIPEVEGGLMNSLGVGSPMQLDAKMNVWFTHQRSPRFVIHSGLPWELSKTTVKTLV